MLAEISIDGLGVIERATARFHDGLTVVTGETGAGKTMVVTSLHLLSGARADAGRVRLGAAKAVVEGRFGTDDLDDTAATAVADVLDAAGAERDDDGTVIVVRSVGADGRSRAHLGGRSVPAGVLAEFADPMLTVHGQNDQLRLLRPEEQRRALDRFAADTVGHKLDRYRTLRREWLDLRTELVERSERGRELAQEADRLRHELAEIDAVAPTAGEDVEIVAEVRRLSDLDSLRDATNTAQAAISGADTASAGTTPTRPGPSTCSAPRAPASTAPTTRHLPRSGHDWTRRSPSSPTSPPTSAATSPTCPTTRAPWTAC